MLRYFDRSAESATTALAISFVACWLEFWECTRPRVSYELAAAYILGTTLLYTVCELAAFYILASPTNVQFTRDFSKR
jgi:hypothetical protein